jgi:hypothetical protein
MSEGISQGPPIKPDPRWEHEHVTIPGTLFYVRMISGPDTEDAWLCVDDGEPDMNDLAKFWSHSTARTFIALANASLRSAAPEPPSPSPEAERHYSWIGDDCPPQWKKVGTIDVADPADTHWALERDYRIGSIYDGMSYSVAEPCAADIYAERDEIAPSPELREALEALVKAWEVLRGPAHFPAYQIARWLQDDMTPAINNARSILAKHKE